MLPLYLSLEYQHFYSSWHSSSLSYRGLGYSSTIIRSLSMFFICNTLSSKYIFSRIKPDYKIFGCCNQMKPWKFFKVQDFLSYHKKYHMTSPKLNPSHLPILCLNSKPSFCHSDRHSDGHRSERGGIPWFPALRKGSLDSSFREVARNDRV